MTVRSWFDFLTADKGARGRPSGKKEKFMLKNGFYTALGTPLDENGRLVEDSLRLHIEQQIEAGAAGLLLMGSMGIETSVRNDEYAKIVDVAIDANRGRLPLFVGAMDNSIARVMEKLDAVGAGKAIDGIVLTVPFYSTPTDADAIYWFCEVANKSPYPIYIYDLAVVTKYKVRMNVIDGVIANPNVVGMKSPDWELIKAIGRKYPDAEFECLYSGLDSFDYACQLGIGKNLDGMFCCTPKNGKAMYECVEKGDFEGARRHLDNILYLRDTMLANGLMQCFTLCMNLLGCGGSFHQDYRVPVDAAVCTARMKEAMEKIGEL